MTEKISSSLLPFCYLFVWWEMKILLFRTRTNCCHLPVLEKCLILSEGKWFSVWVSPWLVSVFKVGTQIQAKCTGLHLPQ